MLKDFKFLSHVICDEHIENIFDDTIVVKKLATNPNSQPDHPVSNLIRKVRHSAPDPMDMRDLLPANMYHRYQTIVSYLEDISSRHQFVELLDLGKTHENRTILAVKIGNSALGDDTPSVVIDGGMHAREWITPATAIFGNNISFSSSGLGPKLSRFVF